MTEGFEVKGSFYLQRDNVLTTSADDQGCSY